MDFDNSLFKDDENVSEDIKKAKMWLFQEQVRIQSKEDDLHALNRELQEMRRRLERERTRLELREKSLDKRFNDNEVFIAKKQKIIEDAYQQLALDRKTLECERLNFEHERTKYRHQKMQGTRSQGTYQQSTYQQGGYQQSNNDSVSYDSSNFFRGVDNEIDLRKRYKELLKIFHPDNKCGDTKTLIRIQAEYENLKSRYYEA
jgi:peptidoglycan hydrolase CwlO-like protein